jgi:hypothetical protein
MTGTVDALSVEELVARGLLDPSTVAEVVERHGVPGSSDPARVLSTHLLGGFDADIIPSRGLDLGRVAWRGTPLSWRSPVQDARALDRPRDDDWLDRFTGGLLTTCGPFHIGAARSGSGLHGDFSHRPASDIRVYREAGSIRIEGIIPNRSLFGPSIDVHRTITSTAGADHAEIRIVDEIRNVGAVPVEVAMLYHLNIGAPLAVPGTRVEIPGRSFIVRDMTSGITDPSPLPHPTDDGEEAVFSFLDVADEEGWSHARISRPSSDILLDIAWRPETLPFLQQWVLPRRGAWALAIEPSSVPLFGETGRSEPAAMLAPGRGRRHEIMVTIREAARPGW